MKKLELEFKPNERPTTTAVNIRVSRPESTRVKGQKILRMSIANFKFKKSSELDHLISPPGTNRELKDKPIKPIQEEGFPSSVRAGPRKFTMPNFNPKQPGIRIVRFNNNSNNAIRAESKPIDAMPTSPTNQFEFMAIKGSSPQTNFHKKSLTATHHQGFFRSPDSEALKIAKIPNQSQQICFSPTNDPNAAKNLRLSLQGVWRDTNKKPSRFEGGFGSNIEEDTTEYTQNTQSKQTISDIGKGRVFNNFSMSVSSQNTVVVEAHTPLTSSKEEKKFNDSTPKTPNKRPLSSANSEAIRIESSHGQKTYKTVDKIHEAKRNAHLYNDQMIKQYQFNKEDEEEELNFLELCDALNSHL